MEKRWLGKVTTDITEKINDFVDKSIMEKMKREEYFIISFKTESRHQMKLASDRFQTNKSQHFFT